MEIQISTLPPVSASPGWSLKSKIMLVAGAALLVFGLWYAFRESKAESVTPSGPETLPDFSQDGPVKIALSDTKISYGTPGILMAGKTIEIRDCKDALIGKMTLFVSNKDTYMVQNLEGDGQKRAFMIYSALKLAKENGIQNVKIEHSAGYHAYQYDANSNEYIIVNSTKPNDVYECLLNSMTFSAMDDKFKNILLNFPLKTS